MDSYGYTCTVAGATQVVDARSFDGSDDKITIPDNAALSFANSNFHIMTWLKVDDTSDYYRLMSKRQSAPNRVNYEVLLITSNPHFYISTYDGSTVKTASSANDSVTAGQWHFVEAYYDESGDMVCAVDLADGTGTSTSGQGDCSHTNELVIGQRHDGLVPFKGDIGEIRIYNRVLSTAERTYIHNLTKGRYL